VLLNALAQNPAINNTLPLEALAVACASHSGQPCHIQWVTWLLAQAQQEIGALRCGCHPPLHNESALALVQQQKHPVALHHNCSGNHAGLLWACTLLGLPLTEYCTAQHPIQQTVLTHLKQLLPTKQSWHWAADGCTLPSYAFTLLELATLAANFATTPQGQRLLQAMQAHPQLVAGDNRFDTVLMQAVPNIVAKGGAEGLVLLWHLGLQQVAVVKAISGDGVLRDFATLQLLRAWGWIPTETPLIEPFELTTLPTPYATIPNTFWLEGLTEHATTR
jgi:L-asparaginase II